MLVSVEVPDRIAHSLRLDEPQSGRRALEMIALEGYRAEELSRGQVSEMLGIGFHETEIFLKAHNAYLHLTLEEFEQERQVLQGVLSR